MSQLSPEDRQQLVKHLKAKWGSVNHAYQVGPAAKHVLVVGRSTLLVVGVAGKHTSGVGVGRWLR